MEKKKVRRFYGYIAFLVCFCIVVAGYSFVTQAVATIYKAQATIAQVQPQIEIARGQRAIDNAIAAQTVAITFESVILSLLSPVAIVVYIVYNEWRKYNEKIQTHVDYTTTTD